MYLPPHFTEERLEVLSALMREYPFATLISHGDDGMIASHLPMLWDADPAPFGTLRGHLARPNPQAKTSAGQNADALAIFLGPQAYVSPSWYASKAEHGKVVPTWNYVAVHAYGPFVLIDDPGWLRSLVTRLTEVHESFSPAPWRVSDAPPSFFDAMLQGIVGLEMPVRRLEGKWKLSQNRSPADQAGTITGLEARGDHDARAVAGAMRARGASGILTR